MALAASGQKSHPVVAGAVDFLRSSVLEDGSWPIDTNLSTWGTTLSVKALSVNGAGYSLTHVRNPHKIANWLLRQQYLAVHPYTAADRLGLGLCLSPYIPGFVS